MGTKGGSEVKRKYGPNYYSDIGIKGGEAVKKQYGPEFYSRIGKLGGWNKHNQNEKLY
jgi:general stress protein YciG